MITHERCIGWQTVEGGEPASVYEAVEERRGKAARTVWRVVLADDTVEAWTEVKPRVDIPAREGRA